MAPTPTSSVADTRARLSRSWDRATAPPQATALWHRAHPDGQQPPQPTVERVEGAQAPEGFAVWRVGGERGPMTCLPALTDDAPLDVRRRYFARVVANCSGTCPECGAVASLPLIDPEHRPAAWSAMPVAVGISHDEGCPCIFAESDQRHFVPFRELGGKA